MTNIVALIATTVLNLQTHLIPVKSNEALTDLVIIEQIPMTQAQRVEKAKALYEEGYDYFYGITRPMNRTKAVEYFGGAGKLENADALFFLSIHQQNHDNLKEATQTAKRSLELGNEAAKIKLGEIQEDEKLMKEGFNALKKKVDSGDMHYANSLGYAYEFGIGTSLSIKEAMKYYEMAAKQNNALGMTNLADLYIQEDKLKKAKPLLVKAAEKEHGYAQYLLAMNFFYYKQENNKEALYWLEKSASNDEPEALYQLGLYYAEKADLAKAIKYYQRAAELNNAEAALELYYIYGEGFGVEQDEDKALFFLKRAAESGNQEVLDELAAMALSGQGNMDTKEAEYWIKKAGYTDEMLKELDKLQEKSLDMFKKMQKPNQ
ncbi:Sel1 repeat protein [Haemophilus parainfluenzae ATCC 33392]|uniref:Tetratricopeptide repeat protein n=1 Tax=Haemophilus parainfluenzae ATCC 33392 TaxID=888828 RepID=A0ABD7ZGS3_HAEPA|nr:tetratricopeptide repeat protein [Haemophilus parainfluenzae]EGC72212.1 Sel1 repeat protein [Haemophilus parainfluenzae ATCC 33392]KFL99875.1 Sel1 repeat protein [Haemophilus parainfluenzae ATCC 33392]QQB23783.1 sel1 repeat family protein [Haemophilus parainfluenzae]WIF09987.1 tetratricopeptide repeat protein [Haemophilus parainfluenzae]WMS23565.1 tetratricopeptide repeat protein [Haemophilus parainfluenzae ATCC 33392]